MTSAKRAIKDANRVKVLIGVSNQTTTIDGVVFTQDVTPVPVAVNPATGAVVLEAG